MIRITTSVVLLLTASACMAGDITFYDLTECGWFRQKELTRDVEYALKDKAKIERCYKMDKRKEYLVIADTNQGRLGIYLDKKNDRLNVDDNIKYIVSQWEADHK